MKLVGTLLYGAVMYAVAIEAAVRWGRGPAWGAVAGSVAFVVLVRLVFEGYGRTDA